MAFKIGFTAEHYESKTDESVFSAPKAEARARKSVVQVKFPKRGMELSYYNDSFDLKCGDMVYVDGKLEGQIGIITGVSYNFKIKLSDYKRVIALVDTDVKGRFFTAGSHFVSFDREAIPVTKIRSWFMAPNNAEEEEDVVSGSDDSFFRLDELSGMNISPAIAERGRDYYVENKVRYICLDGGRGYAIVEGREAYEVEFEFRGGEIRGLICSCFCSGNCKHGFAAMLQLRETLEHICKHYEEELERSDYFAAILKSVLFTFAIDGKEGSSFTL